MTPRSFVSALVASLILASAPSAAGAAWVATLSVGAGDCATVPGTCSGIAPGSAVTVSCTATKGGMYLAGLTALEVSASAGALGAPVTTLTNPASTVVTWTAPASGSATISCLGTDTALNTTSAALIAEVSGAPAAGPTISALDRPTGPVLAGATVALAVTATDPLGGPLSYAWSASGGSFDTASAAAVNWTAPATEGPFDVTVAVSNATGTSTRMERFQVVLSVFQGGLSTLLRAPRRLAAAGGGDIAVADGEGRLYLLTRRGELRGAPVLDAPVSAVFD